MLVPPEMNKKQAAKYLGVSVRTLERYVREGRISVRYEKGRTRTHAVYCTTELEALRSTLAAALKSVPLRPEPTDNSDTVGFRLDAHYLHRLRADGELRGKSAGQLARDLVIAGLENTAALNLEDLHDEVRRLRAELKLHREEFASTVEIVLELLIRMVGGDSITPEEAVEEATSWVRENLERAAS